jgi:hypothetical protein
VDERKKREEVERRTNGLLKEKIRKQEEYDSSPEGQRERMVREERDRKDKEGREKRQRADRNFIMFGIPFS